MSWYVITYQEEGKIKHKRVHESNIKQACMCLTVIEKRELKKSHFKIKRTLPFSEVVSFFRELDIILQADVLFVDALDILYENSTSKQLKTVIHTIKESIENGQQIHENLLIHQKSLGHLPLAFFKIAQNGGNLKQSMHSLVMVLSHIEASKKSFMRAMLYPLVLLYALIFLLIFTFYFLLPKFETLFAQYGTALPIWTRSLLGLKAWVHDYGLGVVLVLLLLGLVLYHQYRTKQSFQYKIDRILACKVPLFSELLLLFVFERFFLSVKTLLHDHYKFQTALINSNVLIRNSYIQAQIELINQQIQSGKSILFAFKKSSLFSDLTLRLIGVGEKTNSLDKTITEIEKIYQKRLDESIKKFTSYIEPLFFVIIASIIVWIMLAIFTPIWNLGETMGI